jgi:hypothetical protein
MKSMLLVLCAGLVFAPACASAGRNFDESRVSNIKTGTTTRAEIEQWFGQPVSRAQVAGSAVGAVLRYTYSYAHSSWGGASTRAKALVVDFNAGDVVVDQSFSSQ